MPLPLGHDDHAHETEGLIGRRRTAAHDHSGDSNASDHDNDRCEDSPCPSPSRRSAKQSQRSSSWLSWKRALGPAFCMLVAVFVVRSALWETFFASTDVDSKTQSGSGSLIRKKKPGDAAEPSVSKVFGKDDESSSSSSSSDPAVPADSSNTQKKDSVPDAAAAPPTTPSEPAASPVRSPAEPHSDANSNQKHSPSLVFMRAPNLEDAASYFVARSELLEEIEISSSHEYGDIDYHSIQQPQQKDAFRSREIDSDDEDNYNEQRRDFIKYMEKHSLRSREKYDPYDDLDHPRKCTRPQWAWDKYFTCNAVHSLSYDRTPQSRHQFHEIMYLAHGAFRDSFMFTPTAAAPFDNVPFVTKTKIYDRDLDNRDVYKISTEANLMEKLSPSPLTSSIYAFCGTTILVERGREIDDDIIPYRRGYHHGRIRKSDLDELQVKDVHPMNQDILSVEKKLDIAIAMAESLAEMHGYVGGVVTNDDIALGQWLYADDDRVILNDFNDAMYMDWNYKKQQYCKYWRSFGGTFKAPEEYDGAYLDESVDIWPMGNIIFALLTGT